MAKKSTSKGTVKTAVKSATKKLTNTPKGSSSTSKGAALLNNKGASNVKYGSGVIMSVKNLKKKGTATGTATNSGTKSKTPTTTNTSSAIQGPDSVWNNVYQSYKSHGKSEEYARNAANNVVNSRNKALGQYQTHGVNGKASGVNTKNTQNSTQKKASSVETGHSQTYYDVYNSAKRAGAPDSEAKKAATDAEKRNSTSNKVQAGTSTNSITSNSSSNNTRYSRDYNYVYNSAKSAGASDAEARKAAQNFANRNKNQSNNNQSNKNPSTEHSKVYYDVYNAAKHSGANEEQAKKAASDAEKRNKGTTNVTSVNKTGVNTSNTSQSNETGHSQDYYNVYKSAKSGGATDAQARKAASDYEKRKKDSTINSVMADFSKGMSQGTAINNRVTDKLSSKSFVYNEKSATDLRDSLQDQKDSTDKTLKSLSNLITTSEPNSSEYHKYKAMYEQLSATNRKTEKLLDQCDSMGKMAKEADNAAKGIVTGISTDKLTVKGTKYNDFIRVFQNATRAGANFAQAVLAAQKATGYKPDSSVIKDLGVDTNDKKGTDLKNKKGTVAKDKKDKDKTNTSSVSKKNAEFLKTYNNILKSGATPEQALEAAQKATNYEPNSKALKEMGIDTKSTTSTVQKRNDFLKAYNNMIKSGATPEQAYVAAQKSTKYKPDKATINEMGLQDVAANVAKEQENGINTANINISMHKVTEKNVCDTVKENNYTNVDIINRLNAEYNPTIAKDVKYDKTLDKLTDDYIKKASEMAGPNATPAEVAFCAYSLIAENTKYAYLWGSGPNGKTEEYHSKMEKKYNRTDSLTGDYRAISMLDPEIGLGACQNYAAATAAIYRKLGFDAKVVGGYIGDYGHFWCQVGDYIFDAQIDDGGIPQKNQKVGYRFGKTTEELNYSYKVKDTSDANGKEAVGYNEFK